MPESLTSPFHGLSAFPITPANAEGRVDTHALTLLLDRLCAAGVDSVGLLGSTGIYAYLSLEERCRAMEAAAEAVHGRVPLVVGIGALRTDDAAKLARHAQAAGADALLMAPVSYTQLTQEEAYEHFRAVTSATGLPLCVYNNPSTTHFTFTPELLQRLSGLPTVKAVKMPLPTNGDFRGELSRLRKTGLAIGYSGDWGMAEAMLSGADAFYSVLGGMLPDPIVALARVARRGEQAEAQRLDLMLQPLWATFKRYGSLRVMYVLLDLLNLGRAEPPRPLLPLTEEARKEVQAAAEPFLVGKQGSWN